MLFVFFENHKILGDSQMEFYFNSQGPDGNFEMEKGSNSKENPTKNSKKRPLIGKEF